MRTWLVESDFAAIAVAFVCCLLVLRRFTSGRWKQRFGAIGSPLMEPPAYRMLFLVVVIGVLLVSTLPEAAFVFPAIDAVGLDIVTILVALELRHYLACVARILGIPTTVDAWRRAPVLWLYACMWPLIWLRTLMGTMAGLRPVQM